MNFESRIINKTYTEYFAIIDAFFGCIKDYFRNNEDSHIDLALKIANDSLISDLLFDSIYDLDDEINKFWKDNLKIVFNYTRKQDTLKCLYSGDTSPVILEKFIKKSALYIDTIILPDPLFELTSFQKQIHINKKHFLYKLIRHTFNIWKLKELVLANSQEKIIIILPTKFYIVNKNDKKKLINTANQKYTAYINLLYNQEFKDVDSCFEFLDRQESTTEIFNEIKNHYLLPNIFKQSNDLNNFLIDLGRPGEVTNNLYRSLGENFSRYFYSQFIRVQEHIYFCNKLIAEPIYDSELPWFFLNYEMGGLDMDASIANALQREKFNWISNIPISALKIFREENKLQYMRNIIRNGITDLKAKNDTDFLKTSEQIEKNFKEAFKQQKLELNLLTKEVKKITKRDIPITAAGFFAGLIPWLNLPVSIVSLKSNLNYLLKKRVIMLQKISRKGKNFVNLLLKSYEKK